MFELLPGYNATPMTQLTMQLPMFSHGSAYAIDWNGDGVLDLFHPNHFGVKKKRKWQWADPAVTSQRGRSMNDWDAVLRNNINGTYHPAKGGFFERTDTKPNIVFDAHASACLDIDGDGYKDFFLTTGGGNGVGNSNLNDNALFWGEEDATSELGYRFVGGRDSARDAGIHGRNFNGNQRGRHHYWFDANGDGFLDVVTLNTQRKDLKPSPGRFYRNLDGRTFKESGNMARNFTEYARMALLTDLDGDGFAHELIVPSQCNTRSQTQLCKRTPRLSLSVYQFDRTENDLVRRTLTKERAKGLNIYDYAKGIATGDFDLDGKADIAILWVKRVDFHLSTTRQRACGKIKDPADRKFCLLRMGEPDGKMDMKSLCGYQGAHGIRFADFNLDGRLDMLVVCATPGRHAIYELVGKNTWEPMKGLVGNTMKFGDLNANNTMYGPPDFCKGVPTTNKDVRKNNKCTNHLSAARCSKLQYKWQFAICSIHKQKRVVTFSPTIADIDNDGFYDIILGHHYGSMMIVRNTLKERGNKNKFLAVKFAEEVGDAEAIGAVIRLTAQKMGPNQNETITQMRVISTRSHDTDAESGVDDRQIFGLGSIGRPIKLRIRWPHCCRVSVIEARKLAPYVNNMTAPFEIPPPKVCDKSCFN